MTDVAIFNLLYFISQTRDNKWNRVTNEFCFSVQVMTGVRYRTLREQMEGIHDIGINYYSVSRNDEGLSWEHKLTACGLQEFYVMLDELPLAKNEVTFGIKYAVYCYKNREWHSIAPRIFEENSKRIDAQQN